MIDISGRDDGLDPKEGTAMFDLNVISLFERMPEWAKCVSSISAGIMFAVIVIEELVSFFEVDHS